jgi:PAS domain S-box-containing protein
MKEMRRGRISRSNSSPRSRKRVRASEGIRSRVRADVQQQLPRWIEHDADSIRQYHELYDGAPIGFYDLDRRARICALNERGAKLLGFPASWLIGKSFVVFIARQDVRRFLDFLMDSIKNRAPGRIELDIYTDHRTQPAEISLRTLGEGQSLLHRMTVVDLTDFRKTEDILQESVANWSSLVQNAPDTIMTVEPGGRITFVNRAMWGYSVKSLVGTNILHYVPEVLQPKVLRCLELSFRRNKQAMCDVTVVGGDSNNWYNFSFGSPHPEGLRDSHEKSTITLVIREITENKRIEDTLRTSGEQLRDFAARLEAVREEERTRVAREIHDELGQALTALKLDLSWVQSKTRRAAEIRKKMKAMMAHVDDTIERVRRISSELRPAILDDLGLIPAIEWQISQFRKRTGIRTQIVSNADGLQLPVDASAAVFRVVQEALTNVMRHANATRVGINLDRIDDALRISIADNGKGIRHSQETGLKSLGIVGMKERISRLGGNFNIVSEPGQGTRLDIVIPT